LSHQKGKPPEALSRAVANLLRLASSDMKDAELLAAGRNPGNAPLLLHIAYRRMVEAVIATERGWPVPAKAIGPSQLPDENPLKLAFARLSKMARMPEPLSLPRDGSIPRNFEQDAFRQDVAGLRKLVQELAEKYRVDLLGDTAALNAVPVRPPAAPAPKPGRVERQSRPTLAPSAEAPKSRSRRSAETPAENTIKRSPIVISDSRSKRQITPAPQKLEGRSPIEAPPSRGNLTSAAFWGLMDRWALPDLAALRLIGHSRGLSKSGTRLRFKLLAEEAEMVKLLFEIDQAIRNLGLDPKTWVDKPIKTEPFKGGTPISYLTRNRLQGTQQVGRYILKNGLKLSISNSL
jgi:hypothetical protein